MTGDMWLGFAYASGVVVSAGYGFYLLGKYGGREEGDYGPIFGVGSVVWPFALVIAFGLWIGRRSAK